MRFNYSKSGLIARYRAPLLVTVCCLLFVAGIWWVTSEDLDQVGDIVGLDTLDLREEMIGWEHIDYHVDGAVFRRIRARRATTLDDMDVLQMEDIYMESGDMNISAGQGALNQTQDVLSFKNGIKITVVDANQGQLYFEADRANVYHDEALNYYFRAFGEPTRFVRTPKSTTNTSTLSDQASGHARQIEYDERTQFLILTGEAELEDAGNYFIGEQLRYFIGNE